MTDYTTADEIAAVWDEVRPEFAGAFHADSYQVRREVRTSDGMGNSTTTEQTVESGRCELIPAGAQGRESYSGPALQAVYRTSAALPVNTIATETDVLVINGRRYQIAAPIRWPGEHGLFPIAELEKVR